MRDLFDRTPAQPFPSRGEAASVVGHAVLDRPPLAFKYAIMVRIHAAALLWARAQISSGGNSGASAGSDTRALLTLLCTHEHDASRTNLAHLLMPAIHRSAWKGACR